MKRPSRATVRVWRSWRTWKCCTPTEPRSVSQGGVCGLLSGNGSHSPCEAEEDETGGRPCCVAKWVTTGSCLPVGEADVYGAYANFHGGNTLTVVQIEAWKHWRRTWEQLHIISSFHSRSQLSTSLLVPRHFPMCIKEKASGTHGLWDLGILPPFNLFSLFFSHF